MHGKKPCVAKVPPTRMKEQRHPPSCMLASLIYQCEVIRKAIRRRMDFRMAFRMRCVDDYREGDNIIISLAVATTLLLKRENIQRRYHLLSCPILYRG